MSAIADPAPHPVSYGRRLAPCGGGARGARADLRAARGAGGGADPARARCGVQPGRAPAGRARYRRAGNGRPRLSELPGAFRRSPSPSGSSVALLLSLRADLPARERDEILELARPALVVADWEGLAFPILPPGRPRGADALPADPAARPVSDPGRALASGGSTGRPKIIVTPGPVVRSRPSARRPHARSAGLRPIRCSSSPGRSTTTRPSSGAHSGLFEGHTLVLMDRFDAARAVDLIERHRVNFAFFAPTMMRRIAQLPDVERARSLQHRGDHPAPPRPARPG